MSIMGLGGLVDGVGREHKLFMSNINFCGSKLHAIAKYIKTAYDDQVQNCTYFQYVSLGSDELYFYAKI